MRISKNDISVNSLLRAASQQCICIIFFFTDYAAFIGTNKIDGSRAMTGGKWKYKATDAAAVSFVAILQHFNWSQHKSQSAA